MTRSTIRTVLAIAAAGLAANANADTMNFMYNDTSGLSATGTLQTSDTGLGYFLATSGTLTVLASPVAGMLGVFELVANPSGASGVLSPAGAFIYNNFIYDPPVSSGYLDGNGLLFNRPGEEINLWGNTGPGNYTAYHWTPSTGYNYTVSTGDMEIMAEMQLIIVPLPAGAWAGFAGLGLVGARSIARRRSWAR